MSAFPMSAPPRFAASLPSVIGCGLITAAWSSARTASWLHDQDRGDVVWIDTNRR